MCAPISITTGGATGGCTGLCSALPQIFASLGVFGVLLLNFKVLLLKAFSFNWMPFSRKAAYLRKNFHCTEERKI